MDCYYKLRQLFYYKLRHGLLQIATGIKKCDGFITNCDRYYKVRWLLQIATVQTRLSVHLREGVRLIGGPLNRGFTVKYYSHCYYKLWQYYAKYADHADKLRQHSHSCLLERELPLMYIAAGVLPPPPFPTTTAAMFLNPKLVIVASRAHVLYPPTTQEAPWRRIVFSLCLNNCLLMHTRPTVDCGFYRHC